MAANLRLPILKGLQTSYDAIGAKNPDVIYITVDTGNMYLGDVQLGGSGTVPGGKTVKDMTIDDETFILTVTYTDDTTSVIDLPMESVFSNAEYDPDTKILAFTLVSDETVSIDLSDLVPVTVDEIDGDTPDTAIPNAGAVKEYLAGALAIGDF